MLRREVPEQSVEICLSSISISTLKQYSIGLKLWWQFCTSQKLDPFVFTVPNVLEFLTRQFTNGATYGTLNSHRSALAQLAGPELASDFRIKRFFKGIFGRRPPKPRYENTWDPSIVLTYVRSLPNNSISLEILTRKLAVLLALATGHRIQTLSLININNIVVKLHEKVEIRIVDRIKSTKLNRPQPYLILPFLKDDPEICVARVLLQYLEKTKELRGPGEFLFITYKRPHHKASSQTISRWIKIILKESGLDINQFKPYSTRHAATSLAGRAGVSFDTIRLAAGWTSNSKTFAQFYNRPLIDNEQFAKTVLAPNVNVIQP